MANPIRQSLSKAVSFLESQGYRYALIGGIANQIWGQPRFTYDIDIKVLVSDTKYDPVRNAILEAFPQPARPDLSNPFIVSVKIGDITVDFLMTAPGYEEQIILRAMPMTIDGLKVWMCTAEDLIIQKAITGRSKDWQDIEGIMIEQHKKLDRQYVDFWLEQFSQALDQPEISVQYYQLWKKLLLNQS